MGSILFFTFVGGIIIYDTMSIHVQVLERSFTGLTLHQWDLPGLHYYVLLLYVAKSITVTMGLENSSMACCPLTAWGRGFHIVTCVCAALSMNSGLGPGRRLLGVRVLTVILRVHGATQLHRRVAVLALHKVSWQHAHELRVRRALP